MRQVRHYTKRNQPLRWQDSRNCRRNYVGRHVYLSRKLWKNSSYRYEFLFVLWYLRTKSQPIPDYDSILAELTPKTIPDEYAKQVEIVKKFTGLISTVLPPHSSRKIEMPQQGAGGRRLNVPIPEQTVTYVLGRITYSARTGESSSSLTFA